MIRLAVVVEGETEEQFIKQLLQRHLRGMGVHTVPVLVGKGSGGRGGNVTVERVASDVAVLFWSFDAVTSLVDFYGFSGKGDLNPEGLEEKIRKNVEIKLGAVFDERRVFPYVQQHEFESLLFSDVESFTDLMNVSNSALQALQAVRSNFSTPEDINDNWSTAPSRRITNVIPGYRKVVDGPLLAENIGLETLRLECPRFNRWIRGMENLNRRELSTERF